VHTASASDAEHADLFWGVRGGGGNFGIVTSFEFQLHPVGPTVWVCAPWYPAEDGKALLKVWRDFMAHAPDELSSNAAIWTVPAAPGIPEAVQGKRAVILAAVYCGPAEEGERLTRPLRELGTKYLDLSGPYPWTTVQQLFDPFFPKAKRMYYFKAHNLDNLDDVTIDALLPRAVNPPAPYVLNVIWHYGGALRRVGVSDTAFRGRDAGFLFSVDCIWDDPADSAQVIAYARAYVADMAARSSGGAYVNFAGFGEEGEKFVREAYGANYQRLAALKKRYDPTNLFRLNQNIKPA
jgi:FAD/FMN-containing dehydrogenase